MTTLRPPTEEEVPAFVDQLSRTFNGSVLSQDDIEASRRSLELDRALCAFEDGRLIATASAESLRLTVPGGAAAASGICCISVLPTHRRRGLLTEMMRRLVEQARERGEPLAGLLASESGIYGRFGFGVATYEGHLRVRARRAAFTTAPDLSGLRVVEPRDAIGTLGRITDAFTDALPGAIRRGERWWRIRAAVPRRPGVPEWRTVVRAQEDGIAVYRSHIQFRLPTLEGGSLEVGVLIALNPEAYAALWRHCLDVDLMDEVVARPRSVDEPLRHLLADPRAMECTTWDGLWLRLVDAEAGLRARTYASDRRVAFHLEDGFCPWNTGTYVVEDGEASRTGAEPDLVLPASALGACYLGGNRFTTLVQAGVVEERTPGSAATADAVFASDRTPWCPFHF